jgi:hypothetical protein
MSRIRIRREVKSRIRIRIKVMRILGATNIIWLLSTVVSEESLPTCIQTSRHAWQTQGSLLRTFQAHGTKNTDIEFFKILSRIQIVSPPGPGSRGQKRTGSRIRIRNTTMNKYIHFILIAWCGKDFKFWTFVIHYNLSGMNYSKCTLSVSNISEFYQPLDQDWILFKISIVKFAKRSKSSHL